MGLRIQTTIQADVFGTSIPRHHPLWRASAKPRHFNQSAAAQEHLATTLTAATAIPQTHAPSSSSSVGDDFHVRTVTPSDYWAVADMHCEAFYPRGGPFWGPLLRLDRVMGLHVGKERETLLRMGRCDCLLAISEISIDWKHAADDDDDDDVDEESTTTTSSSSTKETQRQHQLEHQHVENKQQQQKTLGFFVDTLSKFILTPSMKENYGASHAEAGVLGAVVVDTYLEFVPPKRSTVNGGMIREVPRREMAYLSNLAVSPAAQRQGLGLHLLQRAESVAFEEWKCRSMTLHVDPTNTAAVQLYKNAGYRFVAVQPKWQQVMEGRQTPLALMLKKLTATSIRPKNK